MIVGSEVAQLCLFATPWTVAYQDPQSMGFSRQEYWSGLPFPSPMIVYKTRQFSIAILLPRASLVAQTVRNPAMWETLVRSLGWEDSLEKGTATHSSILAWRIPWTEEPGRLQYMGSQRAGQDWETFTITPQMVLVVNNPPANVGNLEMEGWSLG